MGGTSTIHRLNNPARQNQASLSNQLLPLFYRIKKGVAVFLQISKMVMPSLSSLLVNCGLLACAHVANASQFSGATQVKKHLAQNEYTLLACKLKLCDIQPG